MIARRKKVEKKEEGEEEEEEEEGEEEEEEEENLKLPKEHLVRVDVGEDSLTLLVVPFILALLTYRCIPEAQNPIK